MPRPHGESMRGKEKGGLIEGDGLRPGPPPTFMTDRGHSPLGHYAQIWGAQLRGSGDRSPFKSPAGSRGGAMVKSPESEKHDMQILCLE